MIRLHQLKIKMLPDKYIISKIKKQMQRKSGRGRRGARHSVRIRTKVVVWSNVGVQRGSPLVSPATLIRKRKIMRRHGMGVRGTARTGSPGVKRGRSVAPYESAKTSV